MIQKLSHNISIFFLFISLFSQNLIHAQTDEVNYSQYTEFTVPKDKFEGYETAEVTYEMHAMDVKTNPGVSQGLYLKSESCIDCNLNAIEEVYFEIYQSSDKFGMDLGFIVKKYQNEELLNGDLEKMIHSDNTIYFKKDNYFILFWSDEEDEDIQKEHFEIVEKHLNQKGIKKLNHSDIKDSEFDLIDFSDSTYVKEKIVLKSTHRKIKHLFAAEGGFIVFYDDGTVTLCGDCLFCQDNVNRLALEEPFSIYQENENRIMIHYPDVDIDKPFFLEIHDNNEAEEWYIINHKEVIPIPTICQ